MNMDEKKVSNSREWGPVFPISFAVYVPLTVGGYIPSIATFEKNPNELRRVP